MANVMSMCENDHHYIAIHVKLHIFGYKYRTM